MSARRALSPGDTFGKYTLVRLIGAGGMAGVYEALHVDLHKRVALKVLHASLALRIEVVQRFKLEARAASRFSHPSVVGISDIGAIDGIPFMAMDLLEGESLAEVVDRDGPLPLDRLADVMLPVISAVAFAHEAGVLHRDLKPANIFLKRLRRGQRPMLLDFGISKVDSGGPAQRLTAAGELLGTPPYMSPEQVLHGMDAFDARSDQYALGVVLYECATGKLPFGDHPSVEALLRAIAGGGAPLPSAHRPDLPPAFDALVAKATSLGPEDRFASVIELGAALFPFAGERAQVLWIDDFGPPDAPREPPRPPPVEVSIPEIQALPIFADIAAADLGHLLRLSPPQRFAAGGAIFDQGAPGGTCFVLISGTVEISRTHGADTWDLCTVERGSLLGLSSLWDPGPRPVAALARTECTVIPITRQALEALGSECPAVADRLHDEAAAVAVGRLKAATMRVAEAERPTGEVHREALVRLAAAITEWSVRLSRKAR